MNKAFVRIYSHNGTQIFEDEMDFLFLPRVGEQLNIGKEMDQTDTFIVTDITYFLEDNIMKPFLECESFYPFSDGSLPRHWYLQERGWIKE